VTTPTLPIEGNDELTAVAWLASIEGLSPQMVATRLPPDVDRNGQVAAWVKTGFVTVAVVGGNPDPMLPVSRPVIQVDCWATVPGSNKPPWWKAAAIATTIRRACWDRRRFARPLTITVHGVAYPVAVVQSAYMATAFRRIYDDAGDYARFQGDLALTWVQPGDRID
jgi:hypothetical protein